MPITLPASFRPSITRVRWCLILLLKMCFLFSVISYRHSPICCIPRMYPALHQCFIAIFAPGPSQDEQMRVCVRLAPQHSFESILNFNFQ
ncbi:hypothetical protein BJ912DRAFT_982318 [Pholiota molesta]|nr:hypothetical protein BJ912DRAFT_982318 [Pholiota molesta]